MNELIKNALIENIYMMQDIDITSTHECKWIVSEQNYDMPIIHHSTITYPRMKQTRIKIQLEFHQELPKGIVASLLILLLNLEFAASRVWRTGRTTSSSHHGLGPRRYPSCGQSILRTLLLAAVAVMAAKASDFPDGPPSCSGLGGQVTRHWV